MGHHTCVFALTLPAASRLAHFPAEAPRPHVLVSLLGSVYVRQVHQEQQEQQAAAPAGQRRQSTS